MSVATDESTEQDTPETPEELETPETPEEPEDEPDQHEPPPHEPQPPALTEKDIERMMGKLEKEATAHSNRISAILGEEANDLVRCAMCSPVTPGFYFPQYLDDEVRAAVTEALGLGQDAALQADDEARMCERCQGLGETLTGSKVQGSTTRPCGACKAKGWTSQADRAEWESLQGTRQVVTDIGNAPLAPPPPATDLPAFDPWQRPAGHEFYGMNPVYMTAEQRTRDISG